MKISNEEYAELVRARTLMEVIANMVARDKYIGRDELVAIMGLDAEDAEGCEEQQSPDAEAPEDRA